MKSRTLAMSSACVGLALLLALLCTLAVVAQEPERSVVPRSGQAHAEPAPVRNWEEQKPFSHALPLAVPQERGADASVVDLGQPGLSFRYVQTFGETEVPYLADTTHVNFPYGIGTSGVNIWIGESFGRRAVKYTNTGSFVTSIGTAGVYLHQDTVIDWIADVGVDATGNTWIVDGTSHVAGFDVNGNFLRELGELWHPGSDNNHFDMPAGIAFDGSGNAYVSDGAQWWSSDVGNHRIQIFDSSGSYLNTIGTTGTAGSATYQFRGPRHIAIYGNRLYVADSGNHRVQVFDITNPASPGYVATIGVTGSGGSDNTHLSNPSGVAVDANYVYVADTWNNRVQIFTRSTHAWVATIGTGWGTGNDQFKNPSDVAVDAAGNIFVADFVNCRVQQFSIGRNYVRTYGVTGVPYVSDGYHYNAPSGVAVARDGSVYVVEDNGHRLVKLSAAGVPLWTVGAAGVKGDWDDSNDRLNNPGDVALDAAGQVYVADQWHGRVQIYRPDGSYSATLRDWTGPAGTDSFECPVGLTLASSGELYVTDPCRQRVVIFDHARNYVATLGQTDSAGSDNDHLSGPRDVAVDSNGTIYVADTDNHRIQVFSANRIYVRTMGETGVCGRDFDHLCGPHGLATDAANRLYVADVWDNDRVQVFDSTGAYLTTIGGTWGPYPGQMRYPEGVAVDDQGNVYVTERDNHRIQKFAPGVPGWKQVNLNGFGERQNSWISSLLPFQGALYAAGYEAYVWRMAPDGSWSPVIEKGFGDETNVEIDALAEFSGYLYAATYTWVCDDPDCSTGHTNGPQIWRSADGTAWDDVTPAGGIGSGGRWVVGFAVFKEHLYASVASSEPTHGAEIWRTADGLTWTRVVENGFANDVYNTAVLSLVVHNGYLYAGTRHGDWYDADGHPNGPLGGEVWHTSDGENWTRVNDPGFGTLEAHRVEKMLVFQDGLYAYVSHVGGTANGADVWRCSATVCDEQSDWTKVADNGFGQSQNQYLHAGAVFDGYLYAAVYSLATPVQLWRTPNGSDWARATPYDGLGNSNNSYVYNDAMAVFNSRLYLGITNGVNGSQIWKKTVTADFTAGPMSGPPPLQVSFTNTSAGDYTTSLWDFGDGASSTETDPVHSFGPGIYTVTLTVGDGVDTSTVARTHYIRALYQVYLPLVTRRQ